MAVMPVPKVAPSEWESNKGELENCLLGAHIETPKGGAKVCDLWLLEKKIRRCKNDTHKRRGGGVSEEHAQHTFG